MAERVDEEFPEISSSSATLEEVELIPMDPVPSKIMDHPASFVWNSILKGSLKVDDALIWYPHFYVFGHYFFNWRTKTSEKIMDAWPYAIFHLFCWQLVCWAISVASFITLIVCTSDKDVFSLTIPFTTDFLVAHVYPLAENQVGTPRLGWFYVAALGWQSVILSILLFWPGAYRRYLAGDIAYRIDTWKSTVQAVVIPITFMAILVSVGITNVFLILSLTVGIAFLWLLWHYVIDKTFHSIIRVIANLSSEYRVGGNVKIARDQTLRDSRIVSMTGTEMNGQMGFATMHPLVASKGLAHHMTKGLIEFENEGLPNNEIMYSKASQISLWLNPTINIAIPSLLMIAMLIIIPIAYYGAALSNSDNTFLWWVHLAFWMFMFFFIVDIFFSWFYWAMINKRVIAHSVEGNTETLELLINHYIYTAISWIIWTIVPVFCAFLVLGNAQGHGNFY